MKISPAASCVAAVAVVAMIGLPGLASAGTAAPSAPNYTNCTTLHRTYKHGVGRSNARDHTSGTPVRDFTHNTKAYNTAIRHNARLDTDKDGIACESA